MQHINSHFTWSAVSTLPMTHAGGFEIHQTCDPIRQLRQCRETACICNLKHQRHDPHLLSIVAAAMTITCSFTAISPVCSNQRICQKPLSYDYATKAYSS